MNPGLIVGLLLLLGLPALTILIDVLFPGLVARTSDHVQHRPGRSLGLGLINWLFFGLIALLLFNSDEALRVVGLLIITALLSLVAIGLVAIARLLGQRLWPTARWRPGQPVIGLLVLVAAGLVPLVGWITLPLLILTIGGGAALLALAWPMTASTTVAIHSEEVADESR